MISVEKNSPIDWDLEQPDMSRRSQCQASEGFKAPQHWPVYSGMMQLHHLFNLFAALSAIHHWIPFWEHEARVDIYNALYGTFC